MILCGNCSRYRDGRGLRIKACHRNQPNMSKLLFYFHVNILFKQLYTSNKMESFSYKSERGGRGRTHIEVFKSRAALGYRSR